MAGTASQRKGARCRGHARNSPAIADYARVYSAAVNNKGKGHDISAQYDGRLQPRIVPGACLSTAPECNGGKAAVQEQGKV